MARCHDDGGSCFFIADETGSTFSDNDLQKISTSFRNITIGPAPLKKNFHLVLKNQNLVAVTTTRRKETQDERRF